MMDIIFVDKCITCNKEKRDIFFKNNRVCVKCKYGKDSTEYMSAKFVKNSMLKHKDKYDYSNINFKDLNNEIQLGCKKHGLFNIIPSNHLKGTICSWCLLSYFSKNFLLICISDFLDISDTLTLSNTCRTFRSTYINTDYWRKLAIANRLLPPNTILGGYDELKRYTSFKDDIIFKSYILEKYGLQLDDIEIYLEDTYVRKYRKYCQFMHHSKAFQLASLKHDGISGITNFINTRDAPKLKKLQDQQERRDTRSEQVDGLLQILDKLFFIICKQDITYLKEWSQKLSDKISFKTISTRIKVKNDRVIELNKILEEMLNNPLLVNNTIYDYINLRSSDINICIDNYNNQKERVNIITANLKHTPTNNLITEYNKYIRDEEYTSEEIIQLIQDEQWLFENTNFGKYKGRQYKVYRESEPKFYVINRNEALIEYINNDKDTTLVPKEFQQYLPLLVEEIEKRKNNKTHIDICGILDNLHMKVPREAYDRVSEIEEWMVTAINEKYFVTPTLSGYMRSIIHSVAEKLNLKHNAIRNCSLLQSIKLEQRSDYEEYESSDYDE